MKRAGAGLATTSLINPLSILKPTKAIAAPTINYNLLRNLFNADVEFIQPEQLNFYVPELEGTEYDNQLIEVFNANDENVAFGTTKDSRATLMTTGIDRDVQDQYETDLESKVSAYHDGAKNIVKFSVEENTNIKMTLYGSLGQEIRASPEKYIQKGDYKLPFDTSLLSDSYYFLKIETKYGQTVIGMPIIDGIVQGFNASTINAYRPKAGGSLHKVGVVSNKYKVVVSDNEATKRHYKRTFDIDVNSANQNFEDKVVGYVEQDGVSPELFKEFCDEANFKEGWHGYKGLKTILKNSNREYWISSHNPLDGATATATEQAYVKSLIENEINPHLKTPIPIYVEDPDDPKDLPWHEENGIYKGNDGKMIVLPTSSGGFRFTSSDTKQDGIIDEGRAFIPQGGWSEQYHNPDIEELSSLAFGYNDFNNDKFSGKTVLHKGNKIFPIDNKLIKISECEYFKPKEKIDNILGI